MSASMQTNIIETSHGNIFVTETGDPQKPALLLIHGNSSSSRIFRNQLRSDFLLGNYHIIAFDLPGHGRSDDAKDPKNTYTMTGYAKVAVELLENLGINDIAIVGWSLGGHIGIEMIPLFRGKIRGLMIVGTPPGSGQGFSFDISTGLAAKKDLSEEEIDVFARGSCGGPFEGWQAEDVRRTDGRARDIMFKAFVAGEDMDQREIVETSDVLLAVVNGGDEPFVDLDYLDAIKYKNLWEGKCHRLPGLAHAPFWEAHKVFNPVLERLLQDISQEKCVFHCRK